MYFYQMKNKETRILMNDKEFKVPPGGTLGVLALGSVGVRAWKKSKKEYMSKLKNKKNEEK
jgi:hypothetical protein